MATTRDDLRLLIDDLPDAELDAARLALTRLTPMLKRHDLDPLAREQGVGPVVNFDDLLGDFWPAKDRPRPPNDVGRRRRHGRPVVPLQE